MIKVWKPEGYLSLGGIFGGQSIEGESHYIYTTYNTYEEMLALDENNVKVGLKKNVSNSIFYYNIILI